MNTSETIKYIQSVLPDLSDSQLEWLRTVITELNQPKTYHQNKNSDLISECILNNFGDTLKIHHCVSNEAFTKDKFEHALEWVFNRCLSKGKANLADRGNPGHDLTIDGIRYSLKTQADRNISASKLHISKFHELGKGSWGDQESDLIGLRDQFFDHMKSYDRILSLRCLKSEDWLYELVEIPKALLLRASEGSLEMKHLSKQFPKPGYCYVRDSDGEMLFQLYFDGGSERKLQIKHLQKDLCIVHATWQFSKR